MESGWRKTGVGLGKWGETACGPRCAALQPCPTRGRSESGAGKQRERDAKGVGDMTTNAEARGRFAWYDLNTTDIEAAKRFYRELVGWGVESWGGASHDYAMWVGPRGPFGGLMRLPEEAKRMGAPPHWTAYVTVPEVDASTNQAAKLGAKVLVPPMDIPKVGRFSVMQDPQGAVFCLFASAEDVTGHDGNAKIGEMCWHELATPDPDAAWVFYEALFGWEKMAVMDMGPEMKYQTWGRKGAGLGGMFKKPAGMPGPGAFWLYYINVEDVRKTVEKAKALGATLLNGPEDIPGGGSIAQLLDPQGAAFALHTAPPSAR